MIEILTQPHVILHRLLRVRCLLVVVFGGGFVALRPKSTALVMAGWSVHLTTLFSLVSLNKQLTSTLCTYFH